MKALSISSLTSLALAGAMLSSCVYYSNPVPDMPYRPKRGAKPSTVPAAIPATAATPATPASAQPAIPASALPASTPKATTPAKPATPKPATPATPATPGKHITQPATPATPATPKPATPATPKPAVTPPAPTPAVTPTPTPAPTPATPAQPALISNDGPIPVATRVPGDPLRVYNPLDPSKKIKITDKNGNPQPSGKKLRVPGTNFYFYVP